MKFSFAVLLILCLATSAFASMAFDEVKYGKCVVNECPSTNVKVCKKFCVAEQAYGIVKKCVRDCASAKKDNVVQCFRQCKDTKKTLQVLSELVVMDEEESDIYYGYKRRSSSGPRPSSSTRRVIKRNSSLRPRRSSSTSTFTDDAYYFSSSARRSSSGPRSSFSAFADEEYRFYPRRSSSSSSFRPKPSSWRRFAAHAFRPSSSGRSSRHHPSSRPSSLRFRAYADAEYRFNPRKSFKPSYVKSYYSGSSAPQRHRRHHRSSSSTSAFADNEYRFSSVARRSSSGPRSSSYYPRTVAHPGLFSRITGWFTRPRPSSSTSTFADNEYRFSSAERRSSSGHRSSGRHSSSVHRRFHAHADDFYGSSSSYRPSSSTSVVYMG